MKKSDFGPIDPFQHERVEKLKLRHSSGRDHVSSITIANRLIDDFGSISGRRPTEFLLRVENFYLHLLPLVTEDSATLLLLPIFPPRPALVDSSHHLRNQDSAIVSRQAPVTTLRPCA